jgi:hypothetical protein
VTLSKHAIAKKAAENVQIWLTKYLMHLLTQENTGVQSPSCKEGNQVSSKLGARVILRGILGLDVDADSIPIQINDAWNTVIEAQCVRPVDGVQVEVDG